MHGRKRDSVDRPFFCEMYRVVVETQGVRSTDVGLCANSVDTAFLGGEQGSLKLSGGLSPH